MFKEFPRVTGAEPKYKKDAKMVLKYDVANMNGVMVRGTRVTIVDSMVGNYNQGIRYTVEDEQGNIAQYVDEAVLIEEQLAEKPHKFTALFSKIHTHRIQVNKPREVQSVH